MFQVHFRGIIVCGRDDAGTKGAAATAAALRERGVDAAIVALPEGADVNSFMAEGESLQEFDRLLETARRQRDTL